MNMSAARERVKLMWQWRSAKRLLIVAGSVTVIISLFEIRPSVLAMIREIVTNFITCAAITFSTATLVAAFRDTRLSTDPKRLILTLVLLAMGGMLGGLISWGINDLLFPYQITHPPVYFMMVAILAIIFGLAVFAYETISRRLEETAEKLAEKEVQEQKLMRLKTEAELGALRARVNPHFLFNTLNSIASLIPVSPVLAEEMVQRLSNLFRYILSASERGLVPLGDELDILGEYLEIEKVRLAGRLDYSIEREVSIEEVSIPGMLLQPLVENSVKYGIAERATGGHISIRCRRNGERCMIAIEDTGEGFDASTVAEGFGIGGVRQRLELHYPGAHEFHISSDKGVRIQIGIPLTHGGQNPNRDTIHS
jgi:sensor histidine kinase YesM